MRNDARVSFDKIWKLHLCIDLRKWMYLYLNWYGVLKSLKHQNIRWEWELMWNRRLLLRWWNEKVNHVIEINLDKSNFHYSCRKPLPFPLVFLCCLTFDGRTLHVPFARWDIDFHIHLVEGNEEWAGLFDHFSLIISYFSLIIFNNERWAALRFSDVTGKIERVKCSK